MWSPTREARCGISARADPRDQANVTRLAPVFTSRSRRKIVFEPS
jgi:hypothetical protein